MSGRPPKTPLIRAPIFPFVPAEAGPSAEVPNRMRSVLPSAPDSRLHGNERRGLRAARIVIRAGAAHSHPPLEGEGRRAISAFTRVFDALCRGGRGERRFIAHAPVHFAIHPTPTCLR